MSKRPRPEASTSHEQIPWDEVGPGETYEALVGDHNQRNLRFLYRSSDRSAVKVFKLSEPRNKKIKVLIEKSQYSFRRWIQMHKPAFGNLLDFKYFLYPLRSLIQSVHFLSKKFGDFSFDETDIIVSNSGGDPRLKILSISNSNTTSSGSLIRCMSSIVNIIELWFLQHSTIRIEDHKDLMLLRHCLQNLHIFPTGGRIEMLSLHPVFYTRQELFDMVQRVDSALDKYHQGQHDIAVEIVKALNVVNGNYTTKTCWYEDAKKRGRRSIGAIDRCLNAKAHDKDMYAFLHSVRNLGVHLGEHIWNLDAYAMGQCARNLEELVPGCFSAIFQMILVYGMEGYFLAPLDA